MALREMKELRMVALHGLYNVPLLKMMRLEELHKPRSFHADLKRRIMPTQLERRSARAAVAVTVRCGSVSQTDRAPPRVESAQIPAPTNVACDLSWRRL